MRAFGRFAGYQLWERVVRRPLPVRFEGLTLLCFPHQHSSSGVVYNRLPEWEDMHFVRSFLSPGDLFVDVGANVGVYTLLAASRPGVTVEAFEPGTVAYECLCANVARNDLAPRVRLHKQAVGATSGEVTLTTGRGTMNRVDELAHDGERVPLVRLDDALRDRPALIKIDVEGLELDVLCGAERIIERFRPALLVEANDAAALSAWLDEHDYVSFVYDVARAALQPSGVGAAANFIALHRLASTP